MDSHVKEIRLRVLNAMPDAAFNPPATQAQLDIAQESIGLQFPRWLCDLYQATNGFTGPTGVSYLYPIDGQNGLVSVTSFVRSEWNLPWLNNCIVFSDNGLGGSGTVHWAVLNGQLIEWCYGDGHEYQQLDIDFIAVLRRTQATWNSLNEGDV